MLARRSQFLSLVLNGLRLETGAVSLEVTSRSVSCSAVCLRRLRDALPPTPPPGSECLLSYHARATLYVFLQNFVSITVAYMPILSGN
jgi:hypothetical protein